jgi:MraZ protein
MFRGQHLARVDDKGRLKLPAEFRRELPETQTFYITSLNGITAQLYPLAIWEKKEQALARMPPSSAIRKRLEDVTSFWGQVVEMDAQGRLTLPQMLRETARLTEDVIVKGKPYDPAQDLGFMEVERMEVAKANAAPITADELAEAADFGF